MLSVIRQSLHRTDCASVLTILTRCSRGTLQYLNLGIDNLRDYLDQDGTSRHYNLVNDQIADHVKLHGRNGLNEFIGGDQLIRKIMKGLTQFGGWKTYQLIYFDSVTNHRVGPDWILEGDDVRTVPRSNPQPPIHSERDDYNLNCPCQAHVLARKRRSVEPTNYNEMIGYVWYRSLVILSHQDPFEWIHYLPAYYARASATYVTVLRWSSSSNIRHGELASFQKKEAIVVYV